MTLGEACAGFLAFIRENKTSESQPESSAHERALLLITEYFSPNKPLAEITLASLRDFLARWYCEKAARSVEPDKSTSDFVPDSRELLGSLGRFFKWADQHASTDLEVRTSPVLLEMIRTIPRAIEITGALSSWLRERGGAFSFPEFLTSFEEGGHSEYDLDTPGSVGALEGYFRILRVEGSSVEAEELISEERVWPIVFPPEVASLLDDRYIINLELVRSPAGWQIAGCGFAYPAGTDL